MAPSRITVMKSEIANTSSSRWLTKITALFAALSDFITVINLSTSVAESAAVGSSIKIIFAFIESALAISTTCWSAIDNPRACRFGSKSTPSSLNNLFASLCANFQSIILPFFGWRPINTFSAKVKSKNKDGS